MRPAATRIALQRMPGKTAIPTAFGRVFAVHEHVQRRRGRALTDQVVDPGNPERVAWIFQTVRVQPVFFALRERRHDRPIVNQAWIPVDLPCWNACLAGFGGPISVLVHGLHKDLGWHRRHGLSGQRQQCGNRDTSNNLTVRQGAGAAGGHSAGLRVGFGVQLIQIRRRDQLCSWLENIMVPPKRPHTLRKVRIEVAVIDGIASCMVPVP